MLASKSLLDPLRDMFRTVSHSDSSLGGLDLDPESPFRAIVEDLPDAFIVMDPAGVILYANAAWRELRGLSIEQTVGKNIGNLPVILERKSLGEESRELRSLSPQNRSLVLKLTLRDDQQLQVVYKGWFDADGKLVAVSGLGRDRTDAHYYQEELRAANEALAETNRDLQDFAHVASHDLQEPLRKIRAFSERLTDKYGDDLDERGQDYLVRINSASGRMQQLIHSLLDYARVNSRAGDMVRIDLGQLVAEVLADLELAIDESAATVSVGDLPAITCDRVQMTQVFQNLISNALKFRSPGRPPEVFVDRSDHNGHIAITISDNGIGFEQEQADHIFAPFQRLHARTAYEGSGIGLAVCRRIVERHGGRISASSVPGEGSTFTISL